jgi:competence protein ComEC
MQDGDDDWRVATDGLPSERMRAPRPGDPDTLLAPDVAQAFRAASWWARIGLALELAGQWIHQCYRTEIDAGNTFVWGVAALCAGAAAYFALPHEPSFWALSLVAGLAVAGLVAGRCRYGVPFPALLAAMAAIGLWAVGFEARLVAAPRFDHERTATVTGWVVDAETVLNGATRMTINVTGMSAYRLPVNVIPKRMTVTFRKGTPAFAVGDGIRFLARLRALPGPVMPGGYDFARRAYFEGRGGTGYALGRVEHVNPGQRPWSVWLAANIYGLRYDIAERIRAALPGAEGAIAAAIIVGETRAIPDAENDALRMSGLPHMITIAGLHMSIVASSVFFGVRFLLALIPAIALRVSIKRIAAVAALGAITFYVLMAGPHISAERAYVMAAIMLISVILGRPALTMRNLALSAIVLVAVNPAQVIEPGFLMSFLAVMALIAAYQLLARLRQLRGSAYGRHKDRGIVLHVAQSGLNHMGSAAWSSLIATLATAAITADQFYRVPPYGAITNFIVLPAIDIIAMPCAVLTCLLMPFGLEAVPLYLMGKSIDFMLMIGAFAASLPGGEGLIGRIHPWSSLLAIFGTLWLCLWQQNWRLLGLIPVIVAIALAPFVEQPDVFIGEGAKPIAVRDETGRLRVLATKQDRFTVANWLMADADPHTPPNTRAPIDARLKEGWRCDSVGCVFMRPATLKTAALTIAFVLNPRGFEEDCERADIVITRLKAPEHCRASVHVIDRATLERSGALTLKLTQDQTADAGPRRPWRVASTAALADPSRPWRQTVSAASPMTAIPAPNSSQQQAPTAKPDTSTDTSDLVEPLAPEAFIRDMVLADPTGARDQRTPKKRQPSLLDPVDTLDPPDPP